MLRVLYALLMMLCMSLMSGCGNGTNGSLDLTATVDDSAAPRYSITVTSAYSVATNGIPIDITVKIQPQGGTEQAIHDRLYTDSTGTVSKVYLLDQTNSTVPTYVDVSASSGGLAKAVPTILVPAGS